MKKVAIIQSNYIPWKGYFDMIASVDEFILYDEDHLNAIVERIDRHMIVELPSP